jgi:uncharacterized membrane protein
MQLPHFTLGTAALAIFLVCAGYVLLRGVARALAGLVLLAVSAWLAYLTWLHAPEISAGFFGKPVLPVTLGLPAFVLVGSFWALLKLVRLILNPFGEATDPKRANWPKTLGSFASRLIFATLAAALICLAAAGSLRFAGSAAEVSAFARKSLGTNQDHLTRTLQHLKSELEKALPPSLLSFLSPSSEPSRIAMAKAVIEHTFHPDQPPQPVIDPSTGKPIPRAIPVDEPELKELARSGRFSDLLRHPLLTPQPPAAAR